MFDGVTNPIHAVARPPSQSGRLTHSVGRPAEGMPEVADAVELSDAALADADNVETPPIRRELVERIRAEIAAGEYLTDERIDRVAERLQGVLLERV